MSMPENIPNNLSLLDEPLLDHKQAALFLNVSPGTLAVWDCRKTYDLRPIRVGSRVRYTKTNLIRFLNSQLEVK
jgi:hypothetical protein